MSAQRISLSSKPVIAGVLVLLAIVVGINVAVFKPGRRPARRAEVRVQASQPLPADLIDFRQQPTALRGDLAAWASSATPALARDPFGNLRVRTQETPKEQAVTVAPIPQGPICNAILLGGARPAAVIDGKSYRVGDRFQKYTVAAIGDLGVKLTQASGPAVFLSVHTDRGQTGRSHIITNSSQNKGLESTSLVEHAIGERK